MKKLVLKAVCLVLVSSLVLSGCSGNKNEENNNNSNNTSSTSTETPAKEETPAAKEETPAATTETTEPDEPAEPVQSDEDRWFGKYADPVTVKLAVPTNTATEFPAGDSYSENVWTRAWLDELGIKSEIVWEAVDANGDYETKMNLAIASNELLDVMRFSNYSQFYRLQKAGKLADLTQVFNDYAYPRLKENIMSDGGNAMKSGVVDGKQYGIPQGGTDYMLARMVFIRRDWFEASGKPVPKTIEDVVDIAMAFRDADPANRFGLPFFKKVIDDGFCDMIGMANSYGAYPRIWVEDGSGGLMYGSAMPEMKKVLQVYADLYKGGYIDPAFVSLDGGKVGEQLTSSQLGVFVANFWLPSWPMNSLFASDGVDWDVYPLLPSAELGHPVKAQAGAPTGKLIAVREGYENPEILMKILNFTVAKIDDPERQDTKKFHSDPDDPNNYGYFGFNPLNIVWGDPMTNFNTQYNVTNAIDNNDTSFLVSPHDQTQYTNILPYFEALSNNETPTDSSWVTYKYFYTENSTFGVLNQYFKNDTYLVSKLTGYQTPTMEKQWGNLVTLEDQYITEIVSGVRPVDDWDNFVAEWKLMGGEDIINEVNEWYKGQ